MDKAAGRAFFAKERGLNESSRLKKSENHCLPKTLQDLLPRFLATWPTDIASGERLESELVNGTLIIRSRQANTAKRSWNLEQLFFELAPIPLDPSPHPTGE